MKQFLKDFAADDSGQDMIEYTLIACIIGLTSIAVLRSTDFDLGRVFNNISNSLTNAVA
jgi:pilus assembly protein Flp/PilA